MSIFLIIIGTVIAFIGVIACLASVAEGILFLILGGTLIFLGDESDLHKSKEIKCSSYQVDSTTTIHGSDTTKTYIIQYVPE